ncbi:hypothetical protein BDZ89DRAFT_78828 [Hymenopellis radicata]|nr:hypothetical protein BDZ89DRAFT_78828 [Hymenopellis radicata]
MTANMMVKIKEQFVIPSTAGKISSLQCRVSLLNALSCRAYSTDPSIGAWMHYAIAMTYDLITTTVSVVFLLRFRLSSGNNMMFARESTLKSCYAASLRFQTFPSRVQVRVSVTEID